MTKIPLKPKKWLKPPKTYKATQKKKKTLENSKTNKKPRKLEKKKTTKIPQNL